MESIEERIVELEKKIASQEAVITKLEEKVKLQEDVIMKVIEVCESAPLFNGDKRIWDEHTFDWYTRQRLRNEQRRLLGLKPEIMEDPITKERREARVREARAWMHKTRVLTEEEIEARSKREREWEDEY